MMGCGGTTGRPATVFEGRDGAMNARTCRGCVDCATPQWCAEECGAASEEIRRLRAQVATLTKERDEAVEARHLACRLGVVVTQQREDAQRERTAALERASKAEGEADRAKSEARAFFDAHTPLVVERDAAKAAAEKVRGVLREVLDYKPLALPHLVKGLLCGDLLARAEAASLESDTVPAEIRHTLYAGYRIEVDGKIVIDHRDVPRQIGGGKYHIEAYHLGDGMFCVRWCEHGEFCPWEIVRSEKEATT